jgi:hypothetical protein
MPPQKDSTDVATLRWSSSAGLLAIIFAQASGLVIVWALAAQQSSRFRKALDGLMAMSAVFGALLLASESSEVFGRGLLGLAAAFFNVRLVLSISRERRPFLSLACTGTLLLQTIYAVWMWYDKASFSPFWALTGQPDVVEKIQWMLTGGTMCFGLGLLLPSILFKPLLSGWINFANRLLTALESREQQSLRVLFWMGAGLFVAQLGITGYGYLSNRAASPGLSLLNNVSFIYYLALYALNASAMARGKLNWSVAVIDVLALTYELTSGSKGRFATFVVLPLLLLYLFFNRRPTRAFFTGALVFVAISALFVYPLLVEYRNQISQNDKGSNPELSQMGTAAENWSDSYESKIEALLFGSGTGEQVMAMASIVYFDVRYDSELLWYRLFTFGLPRFIWPQKPSPISANEVGRASGRLGVADMNTSVVITGIGELYAYFGAWGFVLMLLPGVVFAAVESGFCSLQVASPIRVATGLMWLRFFPGLVTGAFEGALTGVLISLILLLACLAIVRSVVLGSGARPRVARAVT